MPQQKIICAWFGIDPNIRCPGVDYIGAPTSCYAASSQTQVISQCQNKTSCSFSGYTAFANVCSGYQNMLYVQWKCVAAIATSITTTTQSAPSSANSCPQTYLNPSGSCVSSSFSPYVPSPLVNSTITYFGYPIYERTICQNGKLVLACSGNQVIHVYSAYFGIQSATTSSTCTANRF